MGDLDGMERHLWIMTEAEKAEMTEQTYFGDKIIRFS